MSEALLDIVRPLVRTQHNPPADPINLINDAPLLSAADKLGLAPAQAAAGLLAADIWPTRYSPNRGTLSAGDQARLCGSVVAIIGAGGLGGVVVTQLARLGVGRLIVCDGDVFDESNLNRQALSNLDRLSKNKARCAVDEAAKINPLVSVEAVAVWAGPDNLGHILHGAHVAVDCLDNMPTRYHLEAAAAKLGIPYVHGAIAGLEGFVMTVRAGDPGLAGLYGPDPAPKEESAEVLLGVPTMTPAAVATLQVNETVKLLLGRTPLQPGQVLHLDLSIPSMESMFLE